MLGCQCELQARSFECLNTIKYTQGDKYIRKRLITCILCLLYPFGQKKKHFTYEYNKNNAHNQIPGVVSAGGYAHTEVVAVTAGGDVHVQSAV